MSFGQSEGISLDFDNMSFAKFDNSYTNFHGERIEIRNSKDSTYKITIIQSEKYKKAELFDFKNNIQVNFDLNFTFKKVEDLDRLKVKDSYYISNTESANKDVFTEVTYKKDSIKNEIIVRSVLYAYTNKKKNKKKILKDFYYIFNTIPNQKNYYNYYKSNFINEFKIPLTENDVLVRFMNVSGNKINTELNYTETKEVEFNFKFYF
ncbi:hypothetical protein ACFO3U_11150 [Flavobacterium ponti]|uniref:Uncharacterized protein n=1 Tax=Flavobacterium ponti TaxID=665133 RepID=A0ABV9P803_9FLAO